MRTDQPRWPAGTPVAPVRARLRQLAAQRDTQGLPWLSSEELAYMERVLDLLQPHAKGDRRLIR